jgi:predicted ArsR family transcriptional regulator
MGEPQDIYELTDEERHLIRLLRHGPQSVTTVAEALRMSLEQTRDVLQSLDRKVGIVRLFRYGTLSYGFAE